MSPASSRAARPLAVLALVASVAVALPAGAGTAGRPVLRSTTVVSSTTSGYVDVELPADARLSPRWAANPDTRFSGSGRMLGLWLQPLGSDGYADDSLEVLRLPAFLGGETRTWGTTTEPAPRCSSSLTGGLQCTSPEPTAILLHRGRYRLTMLTDGRPVQVTLRLRGLPAGSARVQPAHRLASAEAPLPAREAIGDTTVTYGATGPLGGSVRTFVAATATTTGNHLDGASVCERRDPGDAPPFGYGATCPGATSGGYQYMALGHTVGVFGVFVSTAGSTDAIGLGGSFTNDGGVALGRTLGVWLRQP
jgi:hypothetical protein